jgi:hypothetical protein
MNCRVNPTSATNAKALIAGFVSVFSRLQVSARAIADNEPNSTVFSLGVITRALNILDAILTMDLKHLNIPL